MGIITLSGVNAINGSPLSDANSPKLNTDIRFSTTAGQTPVAQTCEAMLPLAQDSIVSSYKLQDATTQGGLLKNLKDFKTVLEAADQRQTISSNTGYTAINTYITDLETRELPVLELLDNCLKEKYIIDTEALDAQKQATEESKDRMQSLQHPERNTSYYEGWFPIFRPMQEVTLFALFGIAMALLTLSLYIFLKMSDVEFNVSFGSTVGGTGGAFASLPPLSEFAPYLGGGLLVGVGGAALVYKYA